MAEYEKMGWGCTLEWASSARSAAVSNTKNRMKQNPTFSYDRNTDLHQLLDFQKKRNQTLITGNTEMQNRRGKNGLRNWMKTHMGRQVWSKDWAWDGWMAPKWGSGWYLSCTQLLQTTGVPLSALHSDSFVWLGTLIETTQCAELHSNEWNSCLTTAVLQTHSRLLDLTSICKKHYWRGQHFKVIHIV